MISLRRYFLGLRARYHFWHGRRAYRLGRIETAGRHFQEAIASGHESYQAYLLMGKIHFRESSYRRAALFFERAQMANQARFLLEGFPDDFIASLKDTQIEAGRPQYRVVIESVGKERERRTERDRAPAALGNLEDSGNLGDTGNLGDFANRDEWLSHRDRPPIQAGDAVDVDWDDEARRLFED